MTHREDVARMRDIVEVRTLQRRAAEMQALQAQADLRQADQTRVTHLDHIETQQQGWAQSLDARRLDLNLMRAWSAAIGTAHAELRGLDVARDEAEAVRAHAGLAWNAAIARADVAEELALAARQRARRRRDEAALAEMADRLIQGRRVP
jgi:hypothetical protein